MRPSLIISLLIALVAVIFALQNTEVIQVKFVLWVIEGSLALILMVTFLVGVLVGYLASIPGRIKMKKKLTQQQESPPTTPPPPVIS